MGDLIPEAVTLSCVDHGFAVRVFDREVEQVGVVVDLYRFYGLCAGLSGRRVGGDNLIPDLDVLDGLVGAVGHQHSCGRGETASFRHELGGSPFSAGRLSSSASACNS